MPAPTPRNPKRAGRKPTPDPNKKMESFWCDADIAKELNKWEQYGFPTKAAMINFALRNLIQTYKDPNGKAHELHTKESSDHGAPPDLASL